MNETPVCLRLLGRPEVRIGDRTHSLTLLDKPWALLVYLAVVQETVDRGDLAAFLWPDKPSRAGRSNLSSTLYLLEKRIGGGPLLEKEVRFVRWPNSRAEECPDPIDILIFLSDHPPPGCSRIHDPLLCPSCQALLSRRLSLWRGPFLDGSILPESPPFNRWVQALRARAAARKEVLERGLGDPGRRDPVSSPALTLSPAPSGIRSLWERRQITLLSVLVSGPPDMEPEEKLEGERSFLTAAESILRSRGGCLMTSGETTLLAVFGYPVAREDAARRAVHAALDLLKAFRVLAPSGLLIRAGLHTGEGTVDFSRNAPDATGDRTHEANRVAREAPPGELAASAQTVRLLLGTFRAVALDRHVPDRSGGVIDLFLVTEEEMPDPGMTRFLVGRVEELRRLGQTWREVADGQFRTVWITGAAGIGKSALVSELVRLVDTGSAPFGSRIRRYVCRSECRELPFAPFFRTIRRNIGIDGKTPAIERRYRAERFLLSLNQPVEERLPLFLRFLEGPVPGDDEFRRVLTDPLRHEIEEMLFGMARVLVKERLRLMVVEDLQWADPASIAFLGRLFEEVEAPSLLLVLTAREEESLASLSLPAPSLSLSLRPLDRTSSRILIETFSPDNLAPERLREVLDLGEGVPLYLRELLRAGSSERGERLPATVRDLLSARIEELGEGRSVARVAACIGSGFPLSLLLAVLERLNGPDLSQTEILGRVRQILSTGLLEEDVPGPDPVLAFNQALFREALIASLPPMVRREIHRVITDTMTRDFPELVLKDPDLLARHRTWSEDPGK